MDEFINLLHCGSRSVFHEKVSDIRNRTGLFECVFPHVDKKLDGLDDFYCVNVIGVFDQLAGFFSNGPALGRAAHEGGDCESYKKH